jgi:outer membrane receptor protein involved in Fe transport
VKAGLDGDLAGGWRWDASLVYGDSKQRQASIEPRLINFYAAVDSVLGPSGAPICQAAIADPARFSDCVPINLFGEGNISKQALDYIRKPSQFEVNNNMQIFAANIYGDVFSTGAGPVAVAAGFETRRQTMIQTSNSDPAIARNFGTIRGVPAGALWSLRQNAGIADGEVEVSEVYAEAAVPLARDLPWARDLDLNLAVRMTDYSTSGSVTTWKVGATYRPIDELLLRTTVSRDIAAPGLSQLFAGLQASPSSPATPDPHTNATGTYLIQTKGNPTLRPEVGSMIVSGAVYTPEWAPGFSAAVDVTSLLIEDAIFTQAHGQIIIDCESSNGLGPTCPLIIRPFPFENRTAANFPSIVDVVPLNLSKQFQMGADIELAYRGQANQIFAGVPGDFSVRALATYTPTNKRRLSPFNSTQESAGGTFGGDLVTDGFPIWRGSLDFGYTNGPFSLSLTERLTGSYRRDYFQVFADSQTAPNVAYTDLSMRYKWGPDEAFEGILSVENLFNEEPPLIPSAQNPGLQYPTNKRHYDVMGTYVTLGFRYRH